MQESRPFCRREWILILILVVVIQFIVQVATWLYSERGSALSYLSFAGTLVSIILALLAIIYSYFSNSTLQQLLGAMSTASANVSASSQQITSVTNELVANLSCMPELIKQVGTRVDATHSLLKEYSAMKQLPESSTAQPGQPRPTADAVDAFVKTTSVAGLKSLYICGISLQKQIPVNIKEVCSKLKFLAADYAIGFLVATASANYFDFERVAPDIFTVLSFSPEFFASIKTEIQNRTTSDPDPKSREWDAEELNIIHAYFNYKP